MLREALLSSLYPSLSLSFFPLLSLSGGSSVLLLLFLFLLLLLRLPLPRRYALSSLSLLPIHRLLSLFFHALRCRSLGRTAHRCTSRDAFSRGGMRCAEIRGPALLAPSDEQGYTPVVARISMKWITVHGCSLTDTLANYVARGSHVLACMRAIRMPSRSLPPLPPSPSHSPSAVTREEKYREDNCSDSFRVSCSPAFPPTVTGHSITLAIWIARCH